MPKYKYSSPYHWLDDTASQWTQVELYAALMALAAQVDGDTIQDVFQSDMDKDGYFDAVKED